MKCNSTETLTDFSQEWGDKSHFSRTKTVVGRKLGGENAKTSNSIQELAKIQKFRARFLVGKIQKFSR